MAEVIKHNILDLTGLETQFLRKILVEDLQVAVESLVGLKRMELIELICDLEDPRTAVGRRPLPPDHYRVRVESLVLPTRRELLRTYQNVDLLFDGRPWADVYELDGFDMPIRISGGLTTFFIRCFGREISSDHAILAADGDRRPEAPLGYRPATAVETLAFTSRYPRLESVVTIVALGSRISDDQGYINVAVFTGLAGSDRKIHAFRFNFKWPAPVHFLFVPNQP